MTNKPLAFVCLLFLPLLLYGCGGRAPGAAETGRPGGPPAPPTYSGSLRAVPAPWARVASNLAAKGLPADRLAGFFGDSGLKFTPKPMETKLRELFPIFFRSELTKAVQEKLWQLGYDLTVDGRAGSGTSAAVKAFQRDRGLPQSAKISRALSAQLDKALASGKVRDLRDYKPPPAAAPSRSKTYPQFTNSGAVSQIRAHYLGDKALFDQAERAYQVPGPLIASIMWIETGYGNYFGNTLAAANLASMAAAQDYSVIRPYVSDLEEDGEALEFLTDTAKKRGLWAQDELQALLDYAWRNGLDPMKFPGSVYGAVGWGQFMPSNISKYAADGDGDGRVDLFQKPDAIFSIANYLRQNGWSGDMSSEESRRAAIRRYNNSGTYINTVLYVMRALSL